MSKKKLLLSINDLKALGIIKRNIERNIGKRNIKNLNKIVNILKIYMVSSQNLNTWWVSVVKLILTMIYKMNY